ncbi:hypothetical protein Tco_0955488 [Tanacetum coccineum]|uniref:Uncharacterized protein n=1 Tax=Tanacetum coccineum TaxID=301880 RepID=A0ABQ5E7C6_9ASTR
MSSNNASSTVTYTSVSSDSNGPSSWGIPLVNAGEILELDPYEEVAQQGQAHPLSPAYVPDPIELDEHEDDDEDSEEDPSEEREPEDDDDDDDTNDEDEEPTKDEEEEEHLALADSSVVPVVDPVPLAGDTKTIRLKPPMSASMEARIAEHVAAPIPPFNPTYDQAPLGHRAAMIRMRDKIPEEDMPPRRRFVLTTPLPGCDVAESSAAARAPRGQYDFVDAVEAEQGLIRSPGHDTQTIARADDREQMMLVMQESEIFYTQLHDARTDHRDIRLEIDVVRGQRTAYETELHKVRQAYLSFEARNRALSARLETLETHMSRMEWQRQRAEDDAVRHIMRNQVLGLELGLIRIMQGTNDAMTPESIQAMIDRAIQRNSTQDNGSQSSEGGDSEGLQSLHVSVPTPTS